MQGSRRRGRDRDPALRGALVRRSGAVSEIAHRAHRGQSGASRVGAMGQSHRAIVWPALGARQTDQPKKSLGSRELSFFGLQVPTYARPDLLAWALQVQPLGPPANG